MKFSMKTYLWQNSAFLVHKSNIEVIVSRDSLVIKIIYDTEEITLFWNDFLEKGDHLLQYIGTDNEYVNKLLLNARSSRVEKKLGQMKL